MNSEDGSLTDEIDAIWNRGYEWIPLAMQYPPYDQTVLVTDGDSWQIRILKKEKKGLKFWKTDHQDNLKYSASHWMPLPKVPE